MLGPKYRKKFSTINAGIVAEIVEKYLNDPESIDESEYELLISTFNLKPANTKVVNGNLEDKRDSAYLHANINPLFKSNTNFNLDNQNLNEKYLGSIGWEFSHLRNTEEKDWLYHTVENINITIDEKKKIKILERLIHVENFEQFLHKSFVGARWYGLEGSESLIISSL